MDLITQISSVESARTWVLLVVMAAFWSLGFALLNYFRVRTLPQSMDTKGASLFMSLIFGPILVLALIGAVMSILGVWDIPEAIGTFI